MVVCASGSAPKPNYVGATVAFSLGSLAALLNNVSTAWAVPLAGYLGILTYDVTLLCNSDPPPMPTITASDALAVLTLDNPAAHLAAISKFSDLIANVLWPQVCQCNSGNPTLPTFPAAPSPLPQINPPSILPVQTEPPCIHLQQNVTTTRFDRYNILPFWGNLGGVADEEWTPTPPTETVTWTLDLKYGTTDPTHFFGGVAGLYVDSTNALPITENQTFVVNNGSTGHFSGTLPAGTTSVAVRNDNTGGSGVTTTWNADMKLFCGDKNAPLTPCCPPDPTLQGAIDNILQWVQQIYQSLPTPIHSYADGAVHSGLSGNGTVTLAGNCLAVRVTITTDSAHLGIAGGDPTYLFDRGYVVPVVNSAPVRQPSRVVYNPQMVLLPQLTEQIGYSLGIGIVASITELTAGP